MQVRSHLFGLRVFPLAQFRNQLKQPGQPIRTFKAGASRGPEVRSFLRDVLCGQTIAQGFACKRREGGVGKSPDQPHEQPMPVDRRMPVVATVERGSQSSGWSDIGIAVQYVTQLVRVLFVDARERKIRKPPSSVDVKTSGRSGRLSTHHVRTEKQEGCAKCGLHRAATLNEMSARLKPL